LKPCKGDRESGEHQIAPVRIGSRGLFSSGYGPFRRNLRLLAVENLEAFGYDAGASKR